MGRKFEILPISTPGTAQLRVGNQGLRGAILRSGSDQATLKLYDNAAGDATGKVLADLVAPANANEGWTHDMSEGIVLEGISYVLAGTGATASVHVSPDLL